MIKLSKLAKTTLTHYIPESNLIQWTPASSTYTAPACSPWPGSSCIHLTSLSGLCQSWNQYTWQLHKKSKGIYSKNLLHSSTVLWVYWVFSHSTRCCSWWFQKSDLSSQLGLIKVKEHLRSFSRWGVCSTRAKRTPPPQHPPPPQLPPHTHTPL